MSASEDEALDTLIDDSWEDFQTIIHNLPTDENLVEHYGFDNATGFVNYVEEELEVGEEDIDRVLEEFENAKCPYCEEENLYKLSGDLEGERVDPTISKGASENRQDSFRDDMDEKVEGVFFAYCQNHDEVFFEYSESWYE